MSAHLPRTPFEALPTSLQSRLGARVQRLGYLGEFFQVAAVQPDVLAPFIDMTEALKAALPDRVTELTALSIAAIMGNAYERHQHERLALNMGFDRGWVVDVLRLDPEVSSNLSEADRTLQRAILTILNPVASNARHLFGSAVDVLGAEQAVAFLFLIGRYVMHAHIVNTLGLAPPVSSPLETGV